MAGALTQADASGWDWTTWLGVGIGVLALAALAVALWWAWRKHGERAKAYAAALGEHLETDLKTVLARIKGSMPEIVEQEGARA